MLDATAANLLGACATELQTNKESSSEVTAYRLPILHGNLFCGLLQHIQLLTSDYYSQTAFAQLQSRLLHAGRLWFALLGAVCSLPMQL